MKFKIYKYGQRYCGYCTNAIVYLRSHFHNADVERINIDENEEAKAFVLSQGFKTVPVIYVKYTDDQEEWELIPNGYEGLLEWDKTVHDLTA